MNTTYVRCHVPMICVGIPSNTCLASIHREMNIVANVTQNARYTFFIFLVTSCSFHAWEIRDALPQNVAYIYIVYVT